MPHPLCDVINDAMETNPAVGRLVVLRKLGL